MKYLYAFIFICLVHIHYSISADFVYPLQNQSPDVMVQFTNTSNSQAFLVKVIRNILDQKTGIDPMKYQFKEPIVVIGDLNTDMEKSAKDMVDGFLNYDFNQGKVKLVMDGLKYDIKNAVIQFKSIEASNEDGLLLEVSVELSDTLITAENINLGFIIPEKNKNAYLRKVKIDLDHPSLYSKKLDSLRMKLVYNLKFNQSGQIEVKSTKNTYDVFESITEHDLEDDIQFNPGEPRASNIQIQIGNGYSTLNNEGIKKALEKRKRNIAKLMFNPLVDIIRSLPSKIIKNKIESVAIPSQFSFQALDKPFELKVDSFGSIGEDQFRAAFNFNWKDRQQLHSSDEKFEQSTQNIFSMIDSAKAEAVISIKQDLFSDLAMEVVNNQFNEKLPKRISIGKNGIQFKMKEVKQGIIAADIDVNIGFVGKVVTGKKHLKIPIFIHPKIEMISMNDIPNVKFSIDQFELDKQTLLYGKDGFESNLQNVRFKKLIINKIKKMLKEYEHKELASIPIEMLKGLDPSIITAESDGYGRFNIALSIDPALGKAQKAFWVVIPNLISQ